MVMLTDLDTAKTRLRIDVDDDDENLEIFIAGASAAVMNYLKVAQDFYEDSFGESVDVPDEVVNATLLLTGILYRDPDGVEMEKWQQGYLPMPVIALLYQLRDPALA